MMAVPAEATPSGKRTPSCRTKERTGKLPSSRSRQTVSSPRRIEKKALSPVSSASRRRLGRAMSSSGKRAEATDPSSRISGPSTQLPLAGSWSSSPSAASEVSSRWTVGRVSPDSRTSSASGRAFRFPPDDPQQGRDPAHHLGALDRHEFIYSSHFARSSRHSHPHCGHAISLPSTL